MCNRYGRKGEMVHRLDSVVGPRHRPLLLALGTMLLSLSVLCVQLALLQAGLVRAQGTLDVCSGCTYESIQEAIDAADPGDIIRVAQGVYTENLVITKSLTLEGGYESSGWTRDIELYETTIDGNRSGSVISVTNGCSTTIDGFTITGGFAEKGAGIHVHGSAVTVTRNLVWDNMAAPLAPEFKMDRPLRDGDTVVTGVGEATEPTWVSLHDKMNGAYLGGGQIQADGRFTITVSPSLVGGQTILALGAKCEQDEAVVEGGDASSHASALLTVGGTEDEGDGAEYPVGLEAKARLLDRESQLDSGGLQGGSLGDQSGTFWLGGGIYVVDSTAIITGNEVVSNTALDFGGGIYAEDSSVTIGTNEISDNRAGAVYPCAWDYGFGGGVALVQGCQFTLENSHIAENVVLRGGGGVFITDSTGVVRDNEIVANHSYYDSVSVYGGGVYIQDCSPRIEGNDILSNTLGSEDFPAFGCAYGGGIYLLGSSSVVTDNEISGNRAVFDPWYGGDWTSVQGGGVFCAHSVSDPSSCVHGRYSEAEVYPTLTNNRVDSNVVRGARDQRLGGGGGLALYRVGGLVEGNVVTNNVAMADGGGILAFSYLGYDDDITVVISANAVISNFSDPILSAGAGGMIVGGMTSTITGNLVQGNVGGLAGGLIVAGPRSVIQGNEIVGNRSSVVGGLFGEEAGQMVVLDNYVAGNTGDVVGGIGAQAVSMVLGHNEILSNTGATGGGVAAGTPATITVDSNLILGNHATERGGGVHVFDDTPYTLTNNIIADNSAEELGGGIYVIDSEGTLVNNTIAENQEGAGEGIYLDGTAEATILNNIIVSHTYGVYNAGTGTPDVTYNDVWGSSVSDYYNVTPGTGNISSDPWFVDPENWDYHLWTTSPAVDAGHPDAGLAPSLDIDGDSRPMGSRVDMGADEVPFEVWVWKSDMPDPVLPGELVTYTIRLSNVSEESIGGLVMTDRVPVDTTLHWASDDYEETEGVVSWSIGSLGVGEQVTRTMVVETNEDLTDGTVINNGQYGADSEELSRPVMGMPVETRVGVPVLEISKTVYPDPVRSGGTLTYTLEVKNNGGIKATGVTISDRVPVNTVFDGASDGGEETDGVVTWSITELGSEESVERTMVVMVAEGLADRTEIENLEYGVNCQEVPEGVTGPAVSTTVREPVVSIEKNDEPDPVLPGAELTYAIEVSNDGGWEATEVVITDRIPADTTFHWASDGGELTGDVVSWTVGSLEPGNSVERTLVVTVSGGLSDNSVIDNDQYGVQSLDLGPVMGTPITTLVGLPMLTISKEVEPEVAFPGGEVEYSLTVHNEGHHVATGVVITDRVPLDTEFAWVLDGGEFVGDEVRWTGLTVGPGESVTVHWGATVRESLLVGEIVNESYGTRCSETSEVVMGEPVSTPLLRHRRWYPMVLKYAP
jgi:uncharacterized repeat protein (TIGR01451 family)